jgi:phosphonate transport system substrate-binding protein
MAEKCGRCESNERSTLTRRSLLTGLALAVVASGRSSSAAAANSVTFGINPLFLDSDIKLLGMLEQYLVKQLQRPVELVKRRTYQEITTMLLSGLLDAAWICDDPYVQHQDRLALLAVPLYHHEPLYETYVIVNQASNARVFDDIRNTVHAFSDPDSTSGYLVTRYQLALRHTTPAEFFRDSFFTYGHRNVVRAVASGLAESGSIDGYVWDVMREREPDLLNKTRVVYRSEQLGFPPIVGLQAVRDAPLANALTAAFLGMPDDSLGREILAILELDGFTRASPDLYHATLEKWLVVKAQV